MRTNFFSYNNRQWNILFRFKKNYKQFLIVGLLNCEELLQNPIHLNKYLRFKIFISRWCFRNFRLNGFLRIVFVQKRVNSTWGWLRIYSLLIYDVNEIASGTSRNVLEVWYRSFEMCHHLPTQCWFSTKSLLVLFLPIYFVDFWELCALLNKHLRNDKRF